MGEFDKSQDKGNQTEQQGEKPAFGQFDNEKGQGQQQEQGQGKQQQDELADADQQGDAQGTTDKGQGDQQR
jgi:hypothetical protein